MDAGDCHAKTDIKSVREHDRSRDPILGKKVPSGGGHRKSQSRVGRRPAPENSVPQKSELETVTIVDEARNIQ